MSNIIPTIQLTETEEALVATALSNPAVQKYFKSMGLKIAAQILEMYAQDDSQTQKFLRDVAAMQGQLSVFNTLLQPSGE